MTLSETVRRLCGWRRSGMTHEERRHSLVGPAKLWAMKREFQNDFLAANGLASSHVLCDLGCGTLRGGIPLIALLDEGHFYGVDVRQAALDEGLKEVEEHGLTAKHPHLIACDDLRNLSIDVRFDIVWSFSVLFHMSDEVLDGAFAFVATHLAQAGTFFANVKIGESAPKQWREFPVIWRHMSDYASLGRSHGLIVEDMGTLESLGHRAGSEMQDLQRMLKITRRPG